jgi:hypothetical protein
LLTAGAKMLTGKEARTKGDTVSNEIYNPKPTTQNLGSTFLTKVLFFEPDFQVENARDSCWIKPNPTPKSLSPTP